MGPNLIGLESLNTTELIKILNEYLIDAIVDQDGDILIQEPVRIYIKVSKEQDVLRIFTFIFIDENKDDFEKKRNDYKEKVAFFNKASSTIKYSLMESPAVMAEYGFLLKGHIDAELLVKTINHFNTSAKFIKSAIKK